MTPVPPLSQYGDRWFRISEKQLYALMQGWTHTNILDKKPILQTVCDQSCTTPNPKCPYWIIARVAGIGGDTNEWVCSRPHTTTPSERDKVLELVAAAIENQKDHKEFLLTRDQKDIVLDIIDGIKADLRTTEAH